jgi:hypothetical protein
VAKIEEDSVHVSHETSIITNLLEMFRMKHQSLLIIFIFSSSTLAAADGAKHGKYDSCLHSMKQSNGFPVGRETA